LTGWRLTALRILSLAAVIAITAFVFSVRDQVEQLGAYGYLGIFLVSVLANSTVILPAPGIAITFAMGAVFHPIGVALAAGSGAALGEMTGYLAGFSGQGVAERTPIYRRLEYWTQRYGGWTILILAFIPNPFFDLAGAAAGALRMPLRRFLMWVWVGKVAKMLLIAYAGAASIDWLARLLG
jgi:membrane protein YqaA with SNARE-associated domain